MPKRFAFRLEVVLVHRQAVEEERSADLARAIGRRLEAERVLSDIDAQEEQSLVSQAELLAAGGFTAMDLAGFVDYRQGLASRRQQGQQTLAQVIREEDRARRALVEARKEREILSHLKDNQYRAWRQELDAAERRGLDELATQAYSRPKFED